MNETIIKLENVSKIYKVGEVETIALKNISFEVNRGEMIAIMGPSGSGKSTLMHIIGFLDRPTLGEYLFEGKDVSKLDDNELSYMRLKKVGFVFQSFNLIWRKNVLENIKLPLIYAGISNKEREKIALEALEKSAFPKKFINHYPNQLSGGMMQRVAIARALVNDPEIILADEPTGNLDTKTGDVILETFQNLNLNFGKTIIIITHELYVAKHCKRIIRIRDGELVSDEINKNQKFVNNHKHEYF